MRAGKLDRRIAIQRKTTTQTSDGEPVETWSTLSERPASVQTIQGDERFASEQLSAVTQFLFTVRWAAVLADLSPLDRIVYPASALADSPSQPKNNTLYDIYSVDPVTIGRNEGIRIMARSHQDESN